MLPLATLIHNNAQNATTNLVPNQLLNGLEPTITPNQGEGSDNPTVELRVDQLRQQRIQVMKALNMVANGKSPSENVFKHRQKVWLEAKNLALPYGSVKLAPRHHGPFSITQVMSPVTYKLELPWFGSELWSRPEPSRTRPRFSLGFGVGGEPDRRSGLGSRVGPNLAEPFRTRSEPQTRRSARGASPLCEHWVCHNCFGFCESPKPVTSCLTC